MINKPERLLLKLLLNINPTSGKIAVFLLLYFVVFKVIFAIDNFQYKYWKL